MTSKTAEIRQALTKLTFENQENNFKHHTYNDDMLQYEYMKRGDMKAIPFGRKLFEGATTGTLSDDPVRNYQYLFVCSATLASRFCIEGGMDSEAAFNMSDVYIRNKRLDAAELLLIYSDFPCADIAEYLAFSSNSHFNNLFKARTGETPLAYRNAHHARHWT